MRYFTGSGSDLGSVSALPHTTFAQLCAAELSKPVKLDLTHAAYAALDKDGQSRAKRVRYLVPAQFKGNPSRRVTGEAVRCNLVALDIDDSREAARLLRQKWSDAMKDYAFVAYHTASSTREAPRIRVIVAADGLALARYGAAVQTVADMLGLSSVTRESMVPVQPMFWPTRFEDDEGTAPYIAYNWEGDQLVDADLLDDADNPTPHAPITDTQLGNLEFLRAPMEGIGLDDARAALAVLDPDMPMQQWIEIAAALKHQFDSDDALAVWDEWSSKGKKYPGQEELGYRWSTLKAQPADRAPVTIRSLFKQAQARGWVNETLTKRLYVSQLEWLTSPARSGEELLDKGAQRIASVSHVVGQLERKSLMTALKKKLNNFGHEIGLDDIKRDVRRIEIEAARSSGIPSWAKGIVYVTALNCFYRPAVDRRFAPDVLDLMYRAPQIGEDKPPRPRDYLVQAIGVSQVENLRYEPRMGDKVVFLDGGVPYVNTYKPTFAKPNAARAQEAGDIFQAHISRLVAEPEYQRTLIDFLAFMVQKPGEKIRWATLIQGGMGCGKTFLSVAMKAVLGSRNVRKLTAVDVAEGTHNAWAYGQQLITVEEVRIVGSNRHTVMDRLKPCISDDDISLHVKFESHRTVPNICNYLMFTNHHDSLAVHDEDRRYFVLASPLQHRKQIAELGEDYFDRLYGMVRDNPGGLRAWFEQWSISPSFKADGRAPLTPYLKELVEASASPLAAIVAQTIEDQPHALVQRDLVSIGCLRGCMDSTHLADFSDQALCNVLREQGWSKWGRTMIDGARHQLWTKNCKTNPMITACARAEVL
jgi:hypothetical protein